MKKFFSVLFILSLTCLMILGITACGKNSAETNRENPEEEFVMPRSEIDADEGQDCPENPTCPENPHCGKKHVHRAQRLPKYCENDCMHERICSPCEDGNNNGETREGTENDSLPEEGTDERPQNKCPKRHHKPKKMAPYFGARLPRL